VEGKQTPRTNGPEERVHPPRPILPRKTDSLINAPQRVNNFPNFGIGPSKGVPIPFVFWGAVFFPRGAISRLDSRPPGKPKHKIVCHSLILGSKPRKQKQQGLLSNSNFSPAKGEEARFISGFHRYSEFSRRPQHAPPFSGFGQKMRATGLPSHV